MKRLSKQIGAGVMVASLVMSSSAVSFATEVKGGTSSGTGSMEGIVSTDVYTVDLPVESNTAYTYIADPQGLIRKTNAAKYSGATFGEGTLFFTNKDGSTTSYSNTSDAATITNKSSKNLSVTVTAKATPEDGGATLATTKTFASDNTNMEIYLGIIDSAGNTEKALTESGAEMTAVLGAAPGDAYEYSYDATADSGNGAYAYSLKSDVSAFTFANYSFQITGAANANATTWAAETKVPAVSVTWAVDLTDDAATVETPAQTPAKTTLTGNGVTKSSINGVDYELTFTKGTPSTAELTFGKDVTAVSGVFQGDSANATGSTSNVTVSGTTLTINGNMWGSQSAGAIKYVTIKFDNNEVMNIKVTIAE